MTLQAVPTLSVFVARAERAAVARATHPFQMAETHSWGASGTHVFTRHPDLPLSLCSNITRPHRHMALVPLALPSITCPACLREFARRVAPQ